MNRINVDVVIKAYNMSLIWKGRAEERYTHHPNSQLIRVQTFNDDISVSSPPRLFLHALCPVFELHLHCSCLNASHHECNLVVLARTNISTRYLTYVILALGLWPRSFFLSFPYFYLIIVASKAFVLLRILLCPVFFCIVNSFMLLCQWCSP
jgi:hypothetical protein